jgi:hypothetical protein
MKLKSCRTNHYGFSDTQEKENIFTNPPEQDFGDFSEVKGGINEKNPPLTLSN